MSAKETSADTATEEDINLEYGDRFRHVITGDIKTVHDARPDEKKVLWAEGGWDYRDELIAAVRDEPSLYEVEARGRDRYEGDGYGDY